MFLPETLMNSIAGGSSFFASGYTFRVVANVVRRGWNRLLQRQTFVQIATHEYPHAAGL